jgi:hypothetical protein
MSPKYAVFLLPFFFFACQSEPPILTSKSFGQLEGDCNQACVEFKLRYPVVEGGSPALQDSVRLWVENVVRNYSVSTEEEPSKPMSFEEAAAGFIQLWKMDEMGMSYAFEVTDTVLALTDRYISLRLDIYQYSGGAHPNSSSEFGVFEVKTGKMIPFSAYIKDQTAILPMLDVAYRAEKQEAFEAGFQYEGESEQISFPTQCAPTPEGVLFHYNTYEIAPYALGDADIFLTWIDLASAASKEGLH